MRAKILGGLGALLTLVAAAVVAVPGLADPLSAVVSVLESRDPERLLLVLGSVVGLYAAWTARAGSPADPAPDGPSARFESGGRNDAPETVTAADRAVTGELLDARIASACSGDETALRAVRSDLAETAVEARVRSADRTPDEARREIRSGAWTDDQLAAAFLADESGPDFPLLARLRAWLDPEAERERRIERTVAEVEAIFESREDDGEAIPEEGDR